MSTTDPTTRDHFAAFPDAPVPTTLAEANRMLGVTRRLLNELGVRRVDVPAPLTLANVCEQLDVDRETLAEALRRNAGWGGAM